MGVPTIYRSSDASAPVMSGAAGSLVAVLDACLVNGYGSKSAAGWTKAFSGTNQASYRQGGGNQFYLDVDDRGASSVLTTPIGNEAAVRGYETMSALSTGTGAFPTTSQVAAATANWRKSSVADSSARTWLLIADDRTFYLFIRLGDVTGAQAPGYGFGDFYSPKSGDGYRTFCFTKSAQNTVSVGGIIGGNQGASFATTNGNPYFARILANTGTSQSGTYLGFATDTGAIWGTQGEMGTTYADRIPIGGGTVVGLRGWLRGLWFGHYLSGLSDGTIINGTNEHSGRQWIVLLGGGGSLNTQFILLETTNWEYSS